jgi:hypothetical protein
MGYAELINVLEKLPPERQAEVFDFAEFLAGRSLTNKEAAAGSAQTLADLLTHPLAVKEGFAVMSRDEIYDRAGLR